jgi:quinohemoprotein ethanol dehydrogenase
MRSANLNPFRGWKPLLQRFFRRGRSTLPGANLGASAAWLLLAAAAVQAGERAPPFAGTALVAPPRTGWPTNGGNWYNQRYSPLTAINRDNVEHLKGVWRARLGGSGVGTQYSGEAQPIVYDGVVYIATGADDVFAISVESGEILWRYEAHLPDEIDTVCCGWSSRGVALGDGKIYVGQLDGKLVALDQQSGDVVWSTQAETWQSGFSITAAPLYYDGLVITGFSGAEYGIRGRVAAFDAKTGEPVWTFYTVPGPGAPGHETWPKDSDAWQYGGGSVWQTPAVDPELGLIYFSTGNPGPDYDGSVRPGDNLYTSSIVALDAKTGEYRWHFQQVHHDIWDYDGPSPVVLFDIEIDGTMHKALAEPSKTGWVYILDRTDGRPLVGIDEKPVPQEPRQATSPTQPYPRGEAFIPQSIDIAPEGYRLINRGRIFTPYWDEEVVITKPGISGGTNWPPSSYDPASGYLYVCGEDSIGAYRHEPSDEGPVEGEVYAKGMFGGTSIPSLGVFAAMDMRTNTIVWRKHWPSECYSGSVATAGGLVFVGRNDGRLTALDTATGDKLWEFQTGAGMNAPATVFEHGGTEYVVAYSAGNLFTGSARGDSVWLFSLGGDMDQVEAANEVMSFPRAAEGTADLANGLKVYQSACTFCHGPNGEGGHGGGPAFTDVGSVGAVVQTVTEGRNQMPAFGNLLSPEDIRDVASYVAEKLAH